MKTSIKLSLLCLLLVLVEKVAAQSDSTEPGYAGEWKKTRLYGHSYNSGDFTDEEYDWIRDHFEYFTIEKTHRRSAYAGPSHEITSRETATKLIKANPRCKPLFIYSIGSGYPQLFESEAEVLITNPEYFLYDVNGEVDELNVENPDQNDWYIETINKNVDNSDLYGTFLDGYKGTYTAHPDNVKYMSDRLHGFRLANGMDFAPNGLTIRSWPEEIDHTDGVFVDSFFRRRVMSKDAGVVLIEALLEVPNDHMIVCFSAYDGYSSTYEFSHAAYLIVANENTYYRWVDEGHLWNSTSLMIWKDAFGKEMGAPLGKAVKNGYVYTRVFEHCTVTLDVENITSSIVWDQNNGVKPEPDYKNVALDGIATQSTTAYNGDASRAIDGNTDGFYNNGSVTHTDTETSGTWWMVSLDSLYKIDEITVYNRTRSAASAGLSDFTIEVLNEDGVVVFTQNITSAPDPSVTVNAGDVVGSQVRILQNLASTALSLAEVEVYGYTPTDEVITAIQEDASSIQFYVFPNPVNDVVSIELENTKSSTYQVLSNAGQILLSGEISDGSTSVDLSQLTSGVYGLRITSETTIQTTKIIKN